MKKVTGDFFFVYKARPFPKQRPIFSRKSGVAFTPPETRAFEKEFQSLCEHRMKGAGFARIPYPTPVELIIDFAYPAPSKDHGRLWKTDRPDMDNLIKAVKDAMNKTLYEDDAQVVTMRCRKIYHRIPTAPEGYISVVVNVLTNEGSQRQLNIKT